MIAFICLRGFRTVHHLAILWLVPSAKLLWPKWDFFSGSEVAKEWRFILNGFVFLALNLKKTYPCECWGENHVFSYGDWPLPVINKAIGGKLLLNPSAPKTTLAYFAMSVRDGWRHTLHLFHHSGSHFHSFSFSHALCLGVHLRDNMTKVSNTSITAVFVDRYRNCRIEFPLISDTIIAFHIFVEDNKRIVRFRKR